VGAVVLVNTVIDPEPIASYARQLLRAAVTGSSAPDAPAVPDPTIVENASEYEGSYLSHNGSFRLVAEDHRLLMDWRGERLMLERRGVDTFLVPHRDFALFLLGVERQDGRAVAASFGSDYYVNQRYERSYSNCAVPESWSAYAGHYRSFSPWLTNFRVIIRRGSLFLVLPAGAEARLIPAGDARFKLEHFGDVIGFDSIVDGRAIEATFITSKYYRVDTP
jgi:D-alanyl-D-alanine carboxypeptidase